jgi:hypothetical protein
MLQPPVSICRPSLVVPALTIQSPARGDASMSESMFTPLRDQVDQAGNEQPSKECQVSKWILLCMRYVLLIAICLPAVIEIPGGILSPFAIGLHRVLSDY